MINGKKAKIEDRQRAAPAPDFTDVYVEIKKQIEVLQNMCAMYDLSSVIGITETTGTLAVSCVQGKVGRLISMLPLVTKDIMQEVEKLK